jgi:hypothetical protein
VISRSPCPPSWPTEQVEFVVACETDDGIAYYKAPVSPEVQSLLEEMLQKTLSSLNDGEMREYELAEQYGTTSSLQTSLDHDALDRIRELSQLPSLLQIDPAVIERFESIRFYLARFFTADKKCLIAVRLAKYFKGVLRQRFRLVRFVKDTLTSFHDQLFKLDSDFDFLIGPADVYILRPANFEAIAGVDSAIAGKLPEKIKRLQDRIGFIDFAPIGEAASERKRISRLISSVASRDDLELIDKDRFLELATQTQVELVFKDGKFLPNPAAGPDAIRGLLEILDRRRYHVRLRSDSGEAFVANARQAILARGR